jgi:hypothetical protein
MRAKHFLPEAPIGLGNKRPARAGSRPVRGHEPIPRYKEQSKAWREIYNLNKQIIGNNPNVIKPDTVLKMPDGSKYTVKPGDSLSSIANTVGTKTAAAPKYYTLPRGTAAPVKSPAVQNDRPYEIDPRSGKIGVNPSGIADVFRNVEIPPAPTADEIYQQMMAPDFAGPHTPGMKHIVHGPEGKEYEFDSAQEARDFVNRIKQLDIHDRASQGLGSAKSESIGSKKKDVAEGKTQKQEAPKPRNFVAKNAINSGAGAHKDKKKDAKQGNTKHKGKMMDLAEMEDILEKASLKLCKSSTPDEDLGASNLASCKSQGLRARDGKKSHKLGKTAKSRVKMDGHKIKGNKYGGPLPDWS